MRLLLVAERPDVVGHGGKVGLGQLRTAVGRHRAGVVLRLRHTLRDGPRDRLDAAVAPQPFAAGQIRTDRRALAVGAVTPRAGSAVDLSLKDLSAPRDLVR